ncbi:glycoside hydrolase family 13 protein [Arcanobacterium hippocoleae]
MPQPSWIADAIFYQIFPDRFANNDPSVNPPQVEPWNSIPTPNNFLGGDIRGIINHLPYLSDLGINAIYLNPIFAADTNHRYDANDYFKIDPHLGSEQDFDELIKAAHALEMRIILDGVFNHCGNGHYAFRDVMANGDQSAYVNWFFIEDFPVRSDSAEFNYKTCTDCYYLPKWNVYNPEVKKHHFDVARHWLDKGIDGWRLDVPYFVNKRFWHEFNQVVKSYGDDKYLVAEDWRNPNHWLKDGLMDGVMNYTLRDLVLAFTAGEFVDAYQFADGMNKLTNEMPLAHRKSMLNLIGSHDTERVLTHLRHKTEKVIQAFALMYGAEGAPMLYYGDENGMAGDNDPGCRAGMQWKQSDWNTKIHSSAAGLIKARKTSEILRKGDQKITALDTDTVMIQRWMEDQGAVTIVHRGKGCNIATNNIPLKSPKAIFGTPSIIGNSYRLDSEHPLMLEGEINSEIW